MEENNKDIDCDCDCDIDCFGKIKLGGKLGIKSKNPDEDIIIKPKIKSPIKKPKFNK